MHRDMLIALRPFSCSLLGKDQRILALNTAAGAQLPFGMGACQGSTGGGWQANTKETPDVHPSNPGVPYPQLSLVGSPKSRFCFRGLGLLKEETQYGCAWEGYPSDSHRDPIPQALSPKSVATWVASRGSQRLCLGWMSLRWFLLQQVCSWQGVVGVPNRKDR